MASSFIPPVVSFCVQDSKTSLMAESGEVDFSGVLTYPFACSKNKWFRTCLALLINERGSRRQRTNQATSRNRNGGRIVNIRGFCLGLAVGTIFTCLLGQWVFSAASKETDSPKGISPEIVTDYVHSVVQADRTFYQTEIVDRMQQKGMVFASENWRAEGDLPLPAQFLQESGRLMAKQGKAIRFRLISSWAINKEHRPMTEFERTGLMKILANPDRPYTAATTDGKARIFQALYADKAVSQHCADCHNLHPNSLKNDFKAGDVMGGLLVTIALPQ
jgi:hypothetical protein